MDELAAEFGCEASPDNLDRLARELAAKPDAFDHSPNWSRLLLTKLRRRAEALRRRLQ